MRLAERTQISPGSPTGTGSSVAGSRISISTPAIGRPADTSRCATVGVLVVGDREHA